MTVAELRVDNDYLEYIGISKRYIIPNVETSVKCILRCPQCTRQGLLSPKTSEKYKTTKSRILNGDDLSIKDAKKLLEFFNTGVALCGSLSDPVYWPNFLEFLDLAKSFPDSAIYIHTAASQKNIEWYRDAFSKSTKNTHWIFGLDGMHDTSAIYRIGQNSKLMFDAMTLCKSMGLHTEWHYIVFKHNLHQLDTAKEFAALHNIKLIFIKSDRTGGNIEVPIEWKPGRNKEFVHNEN